MCFCSIDLNECTSDPDPISLTECPNCGQRLTDEERRWPARDCDGDVLCGECERDDFLDASFACPGCYPEHEEQCPDTEMSDLFVLFDAEYGDPGLYHVISYPFYSQPLIGAPQLYPSSIRRIGTIPAGFKRDLDVFGPPASAAHVCNRCAALLTITP